MPEAAFRTIRDLARREAGLTIPDSKRTLVQSRIARRLRALKLKDFDSYVAIVTAGDDVAKAEMREMISVLTTNVTSFFRESHHFDLLRDEVLVPRMKAGGRMRIWSSACSTGQEPYSIAITILKADAEAARRDIRVLATDIDPAVLERARAGTYPTSQATGLPREDAQRFFFEDGSNWRAKPALTELVAFRELNLLTPWPMKGRFDAIFCRNVVIYFDDDTQRKLWPRFEAALEPGGWLFLGHSERIQDGVATSLERAGVTAYRKRR